MAVERPGTHRTHCCVIHGCKYGHPECPVENKKLEQDFICEQCDADGINSIEEIKILMKHGFEKCPYCGTIHKKGYREKRYKLRG